MTDFSPLETNREQTFVDWVEKKKGCNAIKINKRSWPDRLIVLMYGYCFYIEFKRNKAKFGKRQGEKFQRHTHNKLRQRGFHVYLVDTVEQAKQVFKYEMAIAMQVGMIQTPKEMKL